MAETATKCHGSEVGNITGDGGGGASDECVVIRFLGSEDAEGNELR